MRYCHIAENIYLYGGWDGNQDLADLWSYHVLTGEWTSISKNTDEEVSYHYCKVAPSLRLGRHWNGPASAVREANFVAAFKVVLKAHLFHAAFIKL